jgi:diacylglycerol kinase family enzyme
MVAEGGQAKKLLIVNPAAGSIDPEDAERLKDAFPDYLLVTVKPGDDLEELVASAHVSEEAPVVAVGGDGTIGAIARSLAGTRHPFGIVPRGTFNNFARALGIPLDFEGAVRVIQRGRVRPVTIGRVNGTPFLEAAAIGLFGDALALGEASKDLHYGDALERLRGLLAPRDFEYRLSGDAAGRGKARSLVVANTPFTGARLEVGEGSPEDPYLELTVGVGRSRLELAARLLRGLLRRPSKAAEPTPRVRRVRVETRPQMRVYADVAEVGETPATIEAVPGGLNVLL